MKPIEIPNFWKSNSSKPYFIVEFFFFLNVLWASCVLRKLIGNMAFVLTRPTSKHLKDAWITMCLSSSLSPQQKDKRTLRLSHIPSINILRIDRSSLWFIEGRRRWGKMFSYGPGRTLYSHNNSSCVGCCSIWNIFKPLFCLICRISLNDTQSTMIHIVRHKFQWLPQHLPYFSPNPSGKFSHEAL